MSIWGAAGRNLLMTEPITSIRLPTLDPAGHHETCTLTYAPLAISELRFEGEPLGEVTFVESDFVACLTALREQLEEFGWRILCNGTRLDAYASPLSRQSSGGLRIYLLDEPQVQRDLRSNLFDLFGEAEAGRVASVEEQRTYVRRRIFGQGVEQWDRWRQEWSPPLRKLRPEQAVHSGHTLLTLRSLALHDTGMTITFRLASPSGDVPIWGRRSYPRADLQMFDDTGVTYEPSARGTADNGVMNCGWVRYGLWDLSSWVRPRVNATAQQLTTEVSDLRWATFGETPQQLTTRTTEHGFWRFAIHRPAAGWIPT